MMELSQLLEEIRKRPTLYIGNNSIECLQAFLDGYCIARRHLSIPKSEDEIEFDNFINWLRSEFKSESTEPWSKLFLRYGDSSRINFFFSMYDEYRKLNVF